MNLDSSQDSQQEKTRKINKDIKNEMSEQIFDELTDVSILNLAGGMATITMPIEAVKLLSLIFKKLENKLENNYDKGMTRC